MPQKDNDTKRRIVDIAISLIKEKGYDAVTIQDICSSAGISKHTFYYYFASKEEILLAFHQIPKEISASLLTSILSAPNYVEQFWKLMEPGIDFFADAGSEIMKRVFITNLNRDMGTFNRPKVQSDVSRAQIALLQKARENGEIGNRSDPELLLHMAFMMFIATTSRWCMVNGSFNLKKTVRKLMEACLDVEPSLRWPE